MTCRLVVVAALAILGSAALKAGPPVGPALEPAGVADAATPDVIHLDAIVSDPKDRPIPDLKPSDFELQDNGESRTIESATLKSSQDGRLVAIFLDDYHVEAGASTARVRAALAEFVKSELRPIDLVAVMKPLDSLQAIQITQDRDALRSAIETFEGRKGDYTPRTPFEQSLMSRAPPSADASRAQVVSSALQALALRIGGMREGRKTIVLVSEGFTPTPPLGSNRLTGSLRAVVLAANRYGVAVYPIDPRISAEDTDSDHATSSLQTLADQTGGKASINRDDLTAGMRQAVRDLDGYYELTYRAAAAGDGKFHPVQVRVKRPDAQIRTRSGYWAASPELLRLASSPVPRATTAAFKPSHVSPLIRPWVGMARGPGDLTSVIITWEAGVAPPRNQHVGSVLLRATTDAGLVLFHDRVDSRATFTAPPGHVQLEMIIQGVDGTTLDSDYRWIDVSNLHAARSTIATPQVMRTRSAREFSAESASLDVTPAASREFSRAERLLLRVPVYSADDSVPTVTATLLNRLGTPMRSLSRVPAALPASLVQFDLPLSSLAPDDYRVEVVATSADGQSAKTVILFRITN
jgi:VWFA-related protein